MRYAIIENGVVINVAEADAEFAVQHGWVECPTAGRGWTYANGVFTAPPPAPIPESPPAPTKEQLMAELAALTAKIQALS